MRPSGHRPQTLAPGGPSTHSHRSIPWDPGTALQGLQQGATLCPALSPPTAGMATLLLSSLEARVTRALGLGAPVPTPRPQPSHVHHRSPCSCHCYPFSGKCSMYLFRMQSQDPGASRYHACRG